MDSHSPIVESAVDAIKAADLRSPSPIQYSYAALDNLIIALNGPFVLEARMQLSSQESVFLTGTKSLDEVGATGIDLPNGIALFVCNAQDTPANGMLSLRVAQELLADILNRLRKAEPRVFARFTEDFHSSFGVIAKAALDASQPICAHSDRALGFDHILNGMANTLMPIAREIEKSMKDRPDSHPAPREPSESSFPRFALTFRDFAGPASRVYFALPETQKEAMGYSGNSLPSVPLTESSVGLTDCLKYGFARLWHASSGKGHDPLGQMARSAVLDNDLSGNSRGHRYFLTVPLHLGGLPWATASFLLSQDSSSSRFYIYRDLLPPLFERLRCLVQDAYVNAMVEGFGSCLTPDASSIERTNDHLKALGMVYPLRVWGIAKQNAKEPTPPDWKTLVEVDSDLLCIPTLGLKNPFIPKNSLIGESDDGTWSARPAFGSLFIEHVSQVLSARVAAIDRARRTTAKQQARAWAHDVKNYTQPLIRQLNSLLRERTTPVALRTKLQILREGIVILNSVSNAVQAVISTDVNNATPAAGQFVRLKRANACSTIRRVLSYLLGYHSRVYAHSFSLRWECSDVGNEGEVETSEDFSVDSLTPSGQNERSMSTPDKIWVLALLREVVWNIRINEPVARCNEISIKFSTQLADRYALVTLTQEHLELKPWPADRQIPDGIESANWLYGPSGAGIGQIDVDSPVVSNVVRDGETVYRIRYVVRVRLLLCD